MKHRSLKSKSFIGKARQQNTNAHTHTQDRGYKTFGIEHVSACKDAEASLARLEVSPRCPAWSLTCNNRLLTWPERAMPTAIDLHYLTSARPPTDSPHQILNSHHTKPNKSVTTLTKPRDPRRGALRRRDTSSPPEAKGSPKDFLRLATTLSMREERMHTMKAVACSRKGKPTGGHDRS